MTLQALNVKDRVMYIARAKYERSNYLVGYEFVGAEYKRQRPTCAIRLLNKS